MTAPVSRAGLQDRLRDIQAITEAALTRLDDHDLLAELLARTRDILQADTAAVLLLDFRSGELIATAAAGLEEEVRQGVRIPVGRGFAGRIAAEHQPVILDHVDHTTVLNPILWAKGIRALMGVPLIAGGKVIGVLHVGSLTDREFTSEDVELLQLAADRAATAVHSLTAHEDRVAAAALQRSLLPTALPVADGAQLAARYVPGEGVVGGDWYDVFTLPSGQLCVVIGDVTGHGLPAASDMAQLRNALRAYLVDDPSPAGALSRLDRLVHELLPGSIATVVCAIIDGPGATMRISHAGHPPALIIGTDGPAFVELDGDPLLGLDPTRARHERVVDLAGVDAVVLYSDGLIETRRRDLTAGMAALHDAAADLVGQPGGSPTAYLAAHLVEPGHEDDVTTLVIHRRAGRRR